MGAPLSHPVENEKIYGTPFPSSLKDEHKVAGVFLGCDGKASRRDIHAVVGKDCDDLQMLTLAESERVRSAATKVAAKHFESDWYGYIFAVFHPDSDEAVIVLSHREEAFSPYYSTNVWSDAVSATESLRDPASLDDTLAELEAACLPVARRALTDSVWLDKHFAKTIVDSSGAKVESVREFPISGPSAAAELAAVLTEDEHPRRFRALAVSESGFLSDWWGHPTSEMYSSGRLETLASKFYDECGPGLLGLVADKDKSVFHVVRFSGIGHAGELEAASSHALVSTVWDEMKMYEKRTAAAGARHAAEDMSESSR